MSEKTVMVVNATPNPNEQEAYEYYASKVGPIFKKHGGIPYKKFKVLETIIGNENTQIVAVMEFPDKDAIINAFASEDYKILLPYRNKALSNLSVFIANEI